MYRSKMDKLLEPEKRFPGRQQKQPAVWTSVDSALEIISGVNWGINQYFRLLSCDVTQPFAGREEGRRIISECDLAKIAGTAISGTDHLSNSFFNS